MKCVFGEKEIRLFSKRKCNWKRNLVWIMSIAILLVMISVPIVLAGQKEDTVTILFTHDMHDNFLPMKEKVNGEIISLGGYARLKTAIDIQRKQEEQAILVDAGDYSMGTPFQTIYRSHAPELQLLGEMGYDVVTLGNHEFDYRPAGLTDCLKTAKNSGDLLPQIVQSNVTFPTGKDGELTDSLINLKQAMDDYGVKDYTVIERNGIKIGVFGVMGTESASNAPMSEVVFSDEVEQAKRVVTILQKQEKVDVIVCLSHSGTNEDSSVSEDEILAKEVPEINVIISGHTHTKLSKPIIVGKTIVASGGEYGKNLGVITLSKSEDASWELDQYNLVTIDEYFDENQEIADRISGFKEEVQSEYFDKFGMEYDEVVAASPYTFPTSLEIQNVHGESTLGNLICDSYRNVVKEIEGENYESIAAAITPTGIIRSSFSKGNITTSDIFSVSCLGMGADNMPGYPLISCYLTGKELKTTCEVDASIAPIMKEAQLFMSGLNYTFNPNRFMFNKVLKYSLENLDGSIEEIDDNKLYRVVTGLYSAQMLSVVGDKSYGLLSIVPKKKDGTPITDFEKQIIYETVDGTKRELKEWYALVSYMKSFEQVDGISTIPSYYNEMHNRKIVDDNKNIFALIRNPNKIIITVYIILLVVITLIATISVLIVKRVRRKRKNGISRKKGK